MKKTELEFKALGTEIYLQIVCEEGLKSTAEKSLEQAKDFYFSAEKIFSRFVPESELNYFNHNLGKFSQASPHFLAVAKKNLDYYVLSEGMFDPRIIDVLEWIGYVKDFGKNSPIALSEKAFPAMSAEDLRKDLIIRGEEISFNRRMDFAGIAKGYITDTACVTLRQAGFQNFLIDSGGDMFASGVDQKGENWKIDVEGIAEEKILVTLKNAAIATSGIGKRKWEGGEKRFHHLINPKSPQNFSFDLQSVTVVAPSVTEADFWAKVLFLKGKEEGKKFSKEHKIKSIFLDYRGNAWVSGEMKNII
ncbi:MAG: FAD:protein FMN transferase [Candidatus Moranbacteria bacterium]|nr:FAD:protein FMN transferase [Candidatus Moranbacteria bacterium]